VVGKTYQDKTKDGKDSHEHTWSSTQGKGIQLNEGLRRIEGEESIEVGGAEQEQDGGSESQGTRSHDAG
jgi:hypothetical protein